MKKLIKRGFAALLALTLALGMSVSAFAAEGTTATETAVAEKEYRLTNDKTTSPEETFKFTVTKVGVTDATDANGNKLTTNDMPDLTITPVSYKEGGAGSADSKQRLVVTPNTSFPNVGIYTYKVTEQAGDTAGVTYSKQELTLIATVYHEGYEKDMTVSYVFKDNKTKNPDIVNSYSAGTLSVGKTVTGNLGNKSQKFNINVTFAAPTGKNVKSTITLSDGTQILPSEWKDNGSGNKTVTRTIQLADNQTMEFKNVPYDVVYHVKEDKYEGYTTTYSNTVEGQDHVEGIINSKDPVVHVNNHKDGTVDTGVILHSAPYVLLLVGVGAAAVAFLILKKHREV